MAKKPTVVDLFCGAGGLSSGFKRKGFDILLGIDNDKIAIKTFSVNNPSTKTLCKDIKKITKSEIKSLIGNKRVDVIVGGPPCQGFSIASKRDPNDPRNLLFFEYIRIVKILKPKFFVMENVQGITTMKTSDGRLIMDIMEKQFSKMGYITKWEILNCADFGVPQNRRRMIMIGSINGAVEIPRGRYRKKHRRVKNVLLPKHKVPKKYFYSHRLIAGFKRREKMNKKRGWGFGWQFLDMNKPSYTIPARYWKDGSNALIKYNENCIRKLTPYECKLIQSFPKSYKFLGTEKQIYEQIGNAVPPMLSAAIANVIKKVI